MTDKKYTESVKEGFQDTSGSKPNLEYRGLSDLHLRAQGNIAEKITNRTSRKARTNSTDNQPSKESIKEPIIETQPQYGKNRVISTEAGHLIELDNTNGHERINIQHANGSKLEFRPNGSIKLISKKDRYTAIAGDEELVIRGNASVIIESDASVRVEGDMDLQVEGDLNTLVQGNQNIEIEGDLTERVHGKVTRTFTGDYLRDIRGSVTERNLSNYLCWNVGYHKTNIGGETEITTESTLKIISDDELTMECEGGFIDLKTDDSYIVTGISYSMNYHAEQNYYGNEFHGSAGLFTDLDVENDIEGTAKKATYAETAAQADRAGTAGSLGSGGAASPTTPSATSPTDSDTSPDNTLEAVDVANESDSYISAIDRSVFYENKYNKRKLNTYEVWARMNNKNLRHDSTWLQDQVNYGAILDNASSSSPPLISRTYNINSESKLNSNINILGNRHVDSRSFKLNIPSKPLINIIPESFEVENATRQTRLSPFFTVGNMLGGDANGAQLIEQGGLSKDEIAKNMQLVAFNILEEFRLKYQDRWTISQGLYNLLDQEKLNSDSINKEFVQGLAVGIQFDEDDKGIYYDAGVWASKNLVHDKIILSYIDYDPDDINEPTLIISINNGNNSKTLETHFNNEKISDTLQDLS